LEKLIWSQSFIKHMEKFALLLPLLIFPLAFPLHILVSSVESINYKRVYAIVVSKSTFNDPSWHKVVEGLKEKYDGSVFIYEKDVFDVKCDLARLAPDYVCFVARPSEANPEFVKKVNRLIRELDDDPYPDAVWSILTGFSHEDALRIVHCNGFTVRRVLSGTAAGWLDYVREGIATSETQYCKMWIKYANGCIKEVRGPKDRTLLLASLLNTNRFDIFITSGHGYHNRWQLHYPETGYEGFFKSKRGRVYGEAYNGTIRYINSTNPKIYFGLGNCYIGSIINEDSMPLAWIHSGHAYFYSGYVIEEGPRSYMLGGIPAYFFVQDNYTWAEAFFANGISLIFDMLHNTPGTDPSWLRTDIDGAALYGEPALNVRVDRVVKPLYSKHIHVEPIGDGLYRITVKVRMNRDGKPGWNGKWGNRHPVIILPFRVENITVLKTNAYKAVVLDNAVLLHIWKKGDPPLKAGDERYVVFTASPMKRPRRVNLRGEYFPYKIVTVLVAAIAAGILAIKKILKRGLSKGKDRVSEIGF